MTLRNLQFPALAIAALIGLNGHAAASSAEQQPVAPRPAFEVASIKPNASGSGLIAYGCHGTDTTRPNGMTVLNIQFGSAPATQPTVIPAPLGRCSATNAPLNVLVAYAYGLNIGPDQVSQRVLGGPSWVATARFDIEAKAETPLPESDLRAMLQTLLVDQFKLQAHRDTKEGQGYILLVAKNGPKLKPSEDDAVGAGAQKAPPAGPVTRGGPGGGGIPPGAVRMINNGGQMGFSSRKMTMANFANFLTARLGKTVVDQTQLTGEYDVNLTYTPAEGEGGFFGRGAGGGGGGAASDPAPSLFTALQEQLGLRLETGKVSTETIVIDKAEKPPQQR